MKISPNKSYALAKNAAADFNCDEIYTDFVLGVGFICQFTGGGSPVGVLHIDGCIDDTEGAELWASITNKAVNGDASYFIEKIDFLYKRARLRYVRTSGAGSANAQSMTKGF